MAEKKAPKYKSQALTTALRNAITNAAVGRAFVEPLKDIEVLRAAQIKTVDKVRALAYDTCFTAPTQKILTSAPSDYFPQSSYGYIFIERANGQQEMTRCQWGKPEYDMTDTCRHGDNLEDRKFCHVDESFRGQNGSHFYCSMPEDQMKSVPYVCYDRCRAMRTIKASHPFAKAYDAAVKATKALNEAIENYHTDSAEVREQVLAVCNSVRTTNQLRKLWPEMDVIMAECIVDNDEVECMLPGISLDTLNEKMGLK